MKNIGLFLLSICVAAGLFYFVHGQHNNVQRVVMMPVEIHNKPHDKLVTVDLGSRQLQVTVQGPSFLVADFALSGRSVRMELPDKVGNRFDFTVDEAMLGIPRGIEVLRIEPKKLHASIEDVLTKRVRVVVPREGMINRQIKSFSVIPEVVDLEGPISVLSKIERVRTVSLNMGEIKNDTTIRLPINDRWNSVQVKPEEVIVMLKLAPEEEVREFSEIEVEVRSKRPRRVTVKPNTVWVRLSAPKDIIADMTSEDITAYVKLGNSEKAVSNVKFDVPEGVSVLSYEPTTVEVMHADDGDKDVVVEKNEKKSNAEKAGKNNGDVVNGTGK